MLIETVFRAGGVVTIVLGGLLAFAYAWTGAGAQEPGVYATIVPVFVVGSLFLFVGREAGRDRRALLHLGESPTQDPPKGDRDP